MAFSRMPECPQQDSSKTASRSSAEGFGASTAMLLARISSVGFFLLLICVTELEIGSVDFGILGGD
jgi:hypothetical protein